MNTSDSQIRLKDMIFHWIKESDTVVSAMDIEQQMLQNGFKRTEIRQAVRDLVEVGSLEYRNLLGKTLLAQSFSKPVQLSDRIFVSSQGHAASEGNPKILRIGNRASFGAGDHPTTQLCVRAIDDALADASASGKRFQTGLDIGTGTGILALTAAVLGVEHVDACDRDEVAEQEARLNFLDNHMADRISLISDLDFSKRYDMIMANLRYPTLLDLYTTMVQMSADDGILILSGIRNTEIETVHNLYLKSDVFKLVWSAQTRGWCGVAYKKWKKH